MSELEQSLNMYRTIQKEIGKVQSSVSSAGTQILENEMVLKVHAQRSHARLRPGCSWGGLLPGPLPAGCAPPRRRCTQRCAQLASAVHIFRRAAA